MKNESDKYYSMEFIGEDGKTYVLFYDSKENHVAKREIPHQNITEAIRLNGEGNWMNEIISYIYLDLILLC